MIRNIRQFLFIAGLLLIAAGAQPLGAAVYQWSTVANTNATADPTINWAEGQSPSSVNDSARAMMAAIATARRDWQAVNASGGTASAMTYTSSQGFSSLAGMDGQMISFVAATTNNVGVTLNVNGLGAKPITLDNSGTPLPAGTIVAATPYALTYYNSLGGFFRLWSLPGSPYGIPLGGFITSSIATAPNSNFVIANGQCISRTTYSAYFAAVGTTYGACDGSTTFGVPDMAGRAMVGLDPGGVRMTAAASGCGTLLNAPGTVCASGAQSRTLTTAEIPSHTHANTLNDPGHTHTSNAITMVGGAGIAGGAGLTNPAATINPATTGITINNVATGGGGAHSIVQPTMGVQVFVRIL